MFIISNVYMNQNIIEFIFKIVQILLKSCLLCLKFKIDIGQSNSENLNYLFKITTIQIFHVRAELNRNISLFRNIFNV